MINKNSTLLKKEDIHHDFRRGCYQLLIEWSRRSDDNIWSILGLFYPESELGYSISKIDKTIHIPRRTIEDCIKRLLKNKLIYLDARKVGINKSEKYYKIAEEGAVLFEEWLNYESRKHIQKRLKL